MGGWWGVLPWFLPEFCTQPLPKGSQKLLPARGSANSRAVSSCAVKGACLSVAMTVSTEIERAAAAKVSTTVAVTLAPSTRQLQRCVSVTLAADTLPTWYNNVSPSTIYPSHLSSLV